MSADTYADHPGRLASNVLSYRAEDGPEDGDCFVTVTKMKPVESMFAERLTKANARAIAQAMNGVDGLPRSRG